MTDQQIMYMVSRFLGWRLPENFQPDNGISFNAEYNVEYNAYRGLPPSRRQPYGTNLLDGTQAEAMVRYMVAGMPSPEPVTGTRQETLREAVERLRAIKCEHGASPLTCPKCHPELAEPYEPPPAACPSPIGGKETQAAGQCGCEEKP